MSVFARYFIVLLLLLLLFFFFQAEDGIRDWSVTGVQTCALPICNDLVEIYGQEFVNTAENALSEDTIYSDLDSAEFQIGRASCRERV